MSPRRLSIDADPAACGAGLAALVELQRGGRTDLDAAVAALEKIVSKGAMNAKRGAWREVPTHLASDYEDTDRVGRDLKTFCGHKVSIDRIESAKISAVFECITELCGMVNVTYDPDLANCKTCLRAKAIRDKVREARSGGP